ncbi:hypothetical protein PFISCL1PPCAC_24259, partial [Pristionchus fissidentatus]
IGRPFSDVSLTSRKILDRSIMELFGTVPNEGIPATPTKALLHPSVLLPFSSPSSVSSHSIDSPSKGSGKRKAQPRKRIIIDDDQGSISYMEEMTASTSKEEEEKEKEESMPSFPEDPVEMLNRLNQFLGEAAMQQLLSASAEVTPSGSTPLDAASFSALLTGSATSATSPTAADGVHPMLQAAALAGLQNTPLSGLLSPSPANRVNAKEKNGEHIGSPLDSDELSIAINAALTPAQNARTLTLKRKLFDNNKEAMRAAIASISQEERVDLDDLENFAQQFKKQRIKFGFTQGDVGQALGKRYGTDFSQTTISRFEALNLSFKNMCKLRPLLKEWLAEAELAMANGASAADLLERPPPGMKQSTPVSGEDGMGEVQDSVLYNNGMKKRRKRTNLDNNQKMQLDDEFDKNPRPNHNRMSEIANMLDLDRDVVRVWFCNRRQKVRKLEDERLTFEGATLAVNTLGEALGREMERDEEGGEGMKNGVNLMLTPTFTEHNGEKKPKTEGSMPSPLS